MNDARKKFWIALAVIAIIWLVSFSLSNLLGFTETSSGDKIVIISIVGVLTTSETDSTLFSESTASSASIVNFIEQADKDESVKGIILEINSPGGTVLAGKEVAESVKKTKKPTVALIREVGASGAYWVASAADKIVADDMSITGSVGVTSSYLEFSGLMEKYGVSYEELKAGKYKEEGSPYRKLSPEERDDLQEKINKIQTYFLNEVKKNRNLDDKTVEELKDAKVYLGIEAYDLKLVDYLGGKDLAINVTKDLARIREANVVKYEEKKGLLDVLGRLSTAAFYNIGRGIGAEMLLTERITNQLEIRA